jgi:hypothetical protein
VAFLKPLRFLDAGGRVDMQRVMHLRTASNFSMQPPGMSAAQSLTRETDGFGDMRPAVENLWRVGSRVAREIVNQLGCDARSVVLANRPDLQHQAQWIKQRPNVRNPSILNSDNILTEHIDGFCRLAQCRERAPYACRSSASAKTPVSIGDKLIDHLKSLCRGNRRGRILRWPHKPRGLCRMAFAVPFEIC